MDKSSAEQSLDKLFEGLPVDEASAGIAARCLVELAYLETRARGQNLRHLRPTALSRLMQCFAPQPSGIPLPFKKLTGDELSRFGQKIPNAVEIEFKYWHEDGITLASLPFSIFCKETKRRIFRFFAEPLQSQIRQSGRFVDAKRLETYYDMLKALARHCESLDCLTADDVVASLRASLDLAKSKCNALKEQLQQLALSEDCSGLENKLRRTQAEAAQLSAQVQKCLQGQSETGRAVEHAQDERRDRAVAASQGVQGKPLPCRTITQ